MAPEVNEVKKIEANEVTAPEVNEVGHKMNWKSK